MKLSPPPLFSPLPRYHNSYTRMLAYDRFPYYAPAATDADFAKARGLLDGFAVARALRGVRRQRAPAARGRGVGPVAETYAGVALKSVEALGTAKVATETVRNFSASYAPFKAALARNATRRRAIAAANPRRTRLYEHGRAISAGSSASRARRGPRGRRPPVRRRGPGPRTEPRGGGGDSARPVLGRVPVSGRAPRAARARAHGFCVSTGSAQPSPRFWSTATSSARACAARAR